MRAITRKRTRGSRSASSALLLIATSCLIAGVTAASAGEHRSPRGLRLDSRPPDGDQGGAGAATGGEAMFAVSVFPGQKPTPGDRKRKRGLKAALPVRPALSTIR